MKKWNAVGFDADMYDQLPPDTELRVRIDGEKVYSIIKKDADDIKMVGEFSDFGRQYFIKLEAFK